MSDSKFSNTGNNLTNEIRLVGGKAISQTSWETYKGLCFLKRGSKGKEKKRYCREKRSLEWSLIMDNGEKTKALTKKDPDRKEIPW